MPGILWLLIIVPVAAVIGAWIGVVAARHDFPQLRSVGVMPLMLGAAMTFLPVGRQRKRLSKIAAAPAIALEEAQWTVMYLDVATGKEAIWCRYPAVEAGEAIAALNAAFQPIWQFWREGDTRPDILERRRLLALEEVADTQEEWEKRRDPSVIPPSFAKNLEAYREYQQHWRSVEYFPKKGRE